VEKRRCEPTPPVFGATVGVMSLEFRQDFGIGKLESLGYPTAFLRTDGRTDRRWQL